MRDFIISELNLIQTLCKLLNGTIGLVQICHDIVVVVYKTDKRTSFQ